MNARNWGAINLLNLNAQTTTTQGSASDLSTYATLNKREMKVSFMLSNVSGTHTCAITECDTTNGTFTAPTNGATQGVVTTNGLTEMNFLAQKRYIRAEVTMAASSTANIAVVGFAAKRAADS